MQRTETPLALDHLRVLELPGLAGAYCGKLLADLGADVIKIEPPGGDPMRAIGPFAGNAPGPERSLPFINFHTNKRSAVIDLETEQGRAALRSLVPTVDVIIETYQPGYLDGLGLGYDSLSALNPGIILTSITTFGQTGMYSGFQGADIVANAMAGQMTNQGDPDFPPCNAPLDHGSQLTCLHAAISTLYVLYNRLATGRGDHIDISAQEALAHMNFPIARYDRDPAVPLRSSGAVGQLGINVYPVQDGWVHMYTRRWERLVEWLQQPEFRDPRWTDRTYRTQNAPAADPIIAQFTQTWPQQDFVVESQKQGIPAAAVNTPSGFINDAQVQARGTFQDVSHPLLGSVKLPGGPYHHSETPWRIRRGTPTLGEHTADVLAEAAQPRPRIEVRTPLSPPVISAQAAARAGRAAALPFAGIRVFDLTVAFAGPFGTRYLAELGAEVIKIESFAAETNSGDPRQPQGNTTEINRSKRSVTLDLHHKKAQELARRIARISDFAVANLRPGTLDRWGVGYKDLCEVKPDMIMAEMPGFGNSGPYTYWTSLGQTMAAYSGITHLWGFPDSPMHKHYKGSYVDWVGAGHVATALLAALHYRQRTGKGQYIELAQMEAAAAMTGVAYLDYFVNGHDMESQGNRHPAYAPYSVYPAKGDDRWVAIAVTADEQWASLVRAVGEPSWAQDEGLGTMAGRKAREAEIDRGLAEWTRQYTPHQAMRLLQRAGVPAGAVQNSEDMWLDPHLRVRGYTTVVDQPFLGPGLESGLTMRFRETPSVQPRGMAAIGEANEYVFGELLGMSTAEIQQLMDEKIIN